jgi:uncharacterized protein (TIGR04255 family)
MPTGYQPIRAWEVWNLFKSGYPQVQEQPPLMPTFETFGLPSQHSVMPQFAFSTAIPPHNRYWFLRENGSELLQFQHDRLLHNWRKVGDRTNPYPRFESMLDQFKIELDQLRKYASNLAPQDLVINQCEVSYINHIPFDRSEGASYSDLLNFVSFSTKQPDDFNCAYREIIRDESNKPLGRLYVESNLGYMPSGEEIIAFSLTVKGAPVSTDINAALNFLAFGREIIVRRFAEATTKKAHKLWERIN